MRLDLLNARTQAKHAFWHAGTSLSAKAICDAARALHDNLMIHNTPAAKNAIATEDRWLALAESQGASETAIAISTLRQHPHLRTVSPAKRWALPHNSAFARSAEVSLVKAYTFGVKKLAVGVDMYLFVWKQNSQCSMTKATASHMDAPGLLALSVDTAHSGRAYAIDVIASCYENAAHSPVDIRAHNVFWGFSSSSSNMLQRGTCKVGKGSLVLQLVRGVARQRQPKQQVVDELLAIEDAVDCPCDDVDPVAAIQQLVDGDDAARLDEHVAQGNHILMVNGDSGTSGDNGSGDAALDILIGNATRAEPDVAAAFASWEPIAYKHMQIFAASLEQTDTRFSGNVSLVYTPDIGVHYTHWIDRTTSRGQQVHTDDENRLKHSVNARCPARTFSATYGSTIARRDCGVPMVKHKGT